MLLRGRIHLIIMAAMFALGVFLLGPTPGVAGEYFSLGSIRGDPGQMGLDVERYRNISYGVIFDSAGGDLYAFIYDNETEATYRHRIDSAYYVDETKAIGLPGLDDDPGDIFVAYVQKGILKVVRVDQNGKESEKADLTDGIDGYYAIAGLTRDKYYEDSSWEGKWVVHVDVFDPESSCLVRYSRITGSGDGWDSQYFMKLPNARTSGQVCATAYKSPQQVYAAWFREGGDGLFLSYNQKDEIVSIDYKANNWVDIGLDLNGNIAFILYQSDDGALRYASVDQSGEKQEKYVLSGSKFYCTALAAYDEETVRVLFSNDSSIMSKWYQYGVYRDIEYLGGIELRRAVRLVADGSTRMGYNYSWLAFVDGQAVLGNADNRIKD